MSESIQIPRYLKNRSGKSNNHNTKNTASTLVKTSILAENKVEAVALLFEARDYVDKEISALQKKLYSLRENKRLIDATIKEIADSCSE